MTINKDCWKTLLSDIDSGVIITLIAISTGESWKAATISGVIVFLKALKSWLVNSQPGTQLPLPDDTVVEVPHSSTGDVVVEELNDRSK